MERGQARSATMWQKLIYTMYLRVAIIVASSLALIAASIALNGALHEEDPAMEGEGAEPSSGWSFQRETLAVAGTLIATSAVAIVVQSAFVLATKWGPLVYELGDGARLCVQLTDFITSCLLLECTVVGTVASGVVAYQWVSTNDGASHSNTRDSLYKPVAGSTAFGFLSALLLTVLCVWNACTLCYLRNTCCSRNHRRKLSSRVTPV